MNPNSNKPTTTEWEQIIRREELNQKHGTLSQKEFCDREGITVSALQYWKKRLIKEHHKQTATGPVDVDALIRSELFEFVLTKHEAWKADDTMSSHSPVSVDEITSHLKAALVDNGPLFETNITKTAVRRGLNAIQQFAPGAIIFWDNYLRPNHRSYYFDRKFKYLGAKKKIAKKLATCISAGETFACSSGSTVTVCVEQFALNRQRNTVITNNVGVFDNVLPTMTIDFVGGRYEFETHSCVGSRTARQIRKTRCRTAVISVSGMSHNGDLFVFHKDEAAVHEAYLQMKHLKRLVVLATSNKLGTTDAWPFANLSNLCDRGLEITLITALSQKVGKSDEAKVDILKQIEATCGITIL